MWNINTIGYYFDPQTCISGVIFFDPFQNLEEVVTWRIWISFRFWSTIVSHRNYLTSICSTFRFWLSSNNFKVDQNQNCEHFEVTWFRREFKMDQNWELDKKIFSCVRIHFKNPLLIQLQDIRIRSTSTFKIFSIPLVHKITLFRLCNT